MLHKLNFFRKLSAPKESESDEIELLKNGAVEVCDDLLGGKLADLEIADYT